MIPYPLELFQSTLSLRRATPGGWAGWVHGLISIHALLAESDDTGKTMAEVFMLFQSTLSLRRATSLSGL